MMRRPPLLALGLLALALGACESTQERSERLSKEGGKPFAEQGLDVKRRNQDVQVVDKQILQDRNGTAVVVVLRSRAATALQSVPVEIEVAGANEQTLFKNDQPGIDPALVGPSVLPPEREFTWVNDQVVTDAKAESVAVTPGAAKGPVPGRLPKIEVSAPDLRDDPVSGIQASGRITNDSEIEQTDLVLYCVARKGERIVAAGRGAIPKLRGGKTLQYHIFFIGNPRGARLSIEAPPTILEAS